MKKVLLINGHSINYNNATSLTLESILSVIEDKYLMEIYYYPVNSKLHDNNHIKSYQINKKIKMIYPFIKLFYNEKMRDRVNERIAVSEINKKKSLFNKMKKFILALDDLLPLREKYVLEVMRQVKEFQPEVIYTLGASIFTLKLSYKVAIQFDIPIVLHYMDNWRETLYEDSKIFFLNRKKLKKYLKLVENMGKKELVISDAMAEAYSKKFNNSYFSLMNTVSQFELINSDIKNEEFHIVYAGGLHLKRWRSLKKVADLLEKLNNRNSIKIILDVYTKQNDWNLYGKEIENKYINYKEYLPHDQVWKIYEQADILLHVEGFEKQNITFTKYSLSTKIPEYLETGKPVIAFVPKELEGYQFLKSEGGILVANSTDELIYYISDMCKNDSKRKLLRNSALQLVEKRFSKEYARNTLKRVGML